MSNLNLEKKQIDLVRESLSVHKICHDCMSLFKSGELRFNVMEELVDDRGMSCLYRLKQMCHELFRNAEEASYKEKLYDMTVGYIFHEAMKLRENIYQLEYYTPMYDSLRSSNQLTPSEKKVIREFDVLIGRAKKRLNEGLREVRMLLKQLVSQLKDLLKLYKDNYLLPRFILENEKPFIRIYGKKGYQDLLNEMFERGKVTLIFKAGLSYLDSEYYHMARKLFQKVMQMSGPDGTAQFLFLYSSAFNLYFRNRFAASHALIEEALAQQVGRPELSGYAEALGNLKQDLCREMGRMKRNGEGTSTNLP
ncbi:MAG TPA: hypothetical protein DCR97_05275 [Deltaproteobacteria bacterium]|nr:hypothetical protein [Deltaproteobacteria bacterium]